MRAAEIHWEDLLGFWEEALFGIVLAAGVLLMIAIVLAALVGIVTGAIALGLFVKDRVEDAWVRWFQ